LSCVHLVWRIFFHVLTNVSQILATIFNNIILLIIIDFSEWFHNVLFLRASVWIQLRLVNHFYIIKFIFFSLLSFSRVMDPHLKYIFGENGITKITYLQFCLVSICCWDLGLKNWRMGWALGLFILSRLSYLLRLLPRILNWRVSSIVWVSFGMMRLISLQNLRFGGHLVGLSVLWHQAIAIH